MNKPKKPKVKGTTNDFTTVVYQAEHRIILRNQDSGEYRSFLDRPSLLTFIARNSRYKNFTVNEEMFPLFPAA